MTLTDQQRRRHAAAGLVKIAQTCIAGEDVAALVELTSGSFDATTEVLTYTARPLPLEHEFGDATHHNKTELGERGGGIAAVRHHMQIAAQARLPLPPGWLAALIWKRPTSEARPPRPSCSWLPAAVTRASGGVAIFLDGPECPKGTSYCPLCD